MAKNCHYPEVMAEDIKLLARGEGETIVMGIEAIMISQNLYFAGWLIATPAR